MPRAVELALMVAAVKVLSVASLQGGSLLCGRSLVSGPFNNACPLRRENLPRLSLCIRGGESGADERDPARDAPIDFYYWPVPCGWKVAIMLEECGLPYNVQPVNILQGDQFDPDYLLLNPNNKVPTIVDPVGPDGSPFTVFESGAILLYLGEKADRFLGGPPGSAARHTVLQWLMFQMASVGPMFGQVRMYRVTVRVSRSERECVRVGIFRPSDQYSSHLQLACMHTRTCMAMHVCIL